MFWATYPLCSIANSAGTPLKCRFGHGHVTGLKEQLRFNILISVAESSLAQEQYFSVIQQLGFVRELPCLSNLGFLTLG